MFIVQGGLHNFTLFDNNAGHIQLLVTLFFQSLFIPWFVGIEKLSVLVEIATGERIPKFMIFMIRLIVPLFSVLMLVFAIINEVDTADRTCTDPENSSCSHYSAGMLWASRLIWLGPIIVGAILCFFPLAKQKTFDQLVSEQYGITFSDKELTFLEKLTCNYREYTTHNQAALDSNSFTGVNNKGDPGFCSCIRKPKAEAE